MKTMSCATPMRASSLLTRNKDFSRNFTRQDIFYESRTNRTKSQSWFAAARCGFALAGQVLFCSQDLLPDSGCPAHLGQGLPDYLRSHGAYHCDFASPDHACKRAAVIANPGGTAAGSHEHRARVSVCGGSLFTGSAVVETGDWPL